MTSPSDTQGICNQSEREIQSGQKWNTARGILREIAAALTLFGWRDILEFTSNFIAFAIDWELDGIILLLFFEPAFRKINSGNGNQWDGYKPDMPKANLVT
jgi:hypothetical protein